jgi:hypothetical protein
MKLASVYFRGRDLVVTELAAGELVGIASLPGRQSGPPVDMLDIIRGGEPLSARVARQIRSDESVAHPAKCAGIRRCAGRGRSMPSR